MNDLHPVFWFVQIFIFLLGVAVGHSIILLRIYREENRKRELELALSEKKSDILPQQVSQPGADLEEEQYNARIRQEIDDILSTN
jgi:hypothetical protein